MVHTRVNPTSKRPSNPFFSISESVRENSVDLNCGGATHPRKKPDGHKRKGPPDLRLAYRPGGQGNLFDEKQERFPGVGREFFVVERAIAIGIGGLEARFD